MLGHGVLAHKKDLACPGGGEKGVGWEGAD